MPLCLQSYTAGAGGYRNALQDSIDDVTEDVALHVDNCAFIAVTCCSGLLRQKPVHSSVDVLVYEDVVTLQSVLVQNLPGTRGCQVAKALPPSGVELQR